MKKVLMSALMLLFLSSFAFAQEEGYLALQRMKIEKDRRQLKTDDRVWHKEKRETQKNEVNSYVKDHFRMDFPDAQNVAFVQGPQFSEVVFLNNNKWYRAYYDQDAQLVGTTTQASMNDLPGKAAVQIRKDYPGYTVRRVILYDDNEINDTDMWLYNTEFDDADNYFVELQSPRKQIVLQVNMEGMVSFFRSL